MQLARPLINKMRSALPRACRFIARRFALIIRNPNIYIILGDEDLEFLSNIIERIEFFAPDVLAKNIRIKKRFGMDCLLGLPPVLSFYGKLSFADSLYGKLLNRFYVDHRQEIAAWDWVRLSSYYYPEQYSSYQAYANFSNAISEILSLGYNKSYIFGTGPSLSSAQNREWNDGARIVCNTIVRDSILFGHIQPHFIVAGDALYHFSETPFARQFRKDLAARMEEHDCNFLYPSIFESVVQRELGHFGRRLIGVPIGGPQSAEVNLLVDFRLPALGNVLGLLLLPLASTISKQIKLFGFDGRSPYDNTSLFWANSRSHSYPELMPSLRKSYPFFFKYYVPGNDSKSYIENVHGDLLDSQLANAEANGFSFELLHPSWTQTLNRRYHGSQSPADYYSSLLSY